MTTDLFKTFLRLLDAKMGAANRKILLFTDKRPAHPPDTAFLHNIKVVFFPVSCTSHLQPLDLGIIHSMKVKYRKALVQKAILYTEMNRGLKVNSFEAMHMLTIAWNSVMPETISNCFKKAGFNYSNDTEMDADIDLINEKDWS
jgi:hypothetical protein